MKKLTKTDNDDIKVMVHGPGAYEYIQMFKKRGFSGADNIEEADIICFTGGEDVNPALYNERKLDGIYFNEARDDRDGYVYGYGLAGEKFMVGICRGGQFLNVMNGGKLWQDVNNHTKFHYLVDIETNRNIFVSSTHHQMFRPTSEAKVLAYAQEATFKKNAHGVWSKPPNNVKATITDKSFSTINDVEACYYPSTRSLCFQPHPEFGNVPDCTDYFFELLYRCYDDKIQTEKEVA